MRRAAGLCYAFPVSLAGRLTNTLALLAQVAHPRGALVTPTRADASGDRADGWQNATLGFGTGRDKSAGSAFVAPNMLTDPELTDLYNHNDLAARIVDIPVREAFKNGFTVCVTDDPDATKDVQKYLKRFKLVQLGKAAITWGRLYGGCAMWLRTQEPDPSKPFPEPPAPEPQWGEPEPSLPVAGDVTGVLPDPIGAGTTASPSPAGSSMTDTPTARRPLESDKDRPENERAPGIVLGSAQVQAPATGVMGSPIPPVRPATGTTAPPTSVLTTGYQPRVPNPPARAPGARGPGLFGPQGEANEMGDTAGVAGTLPEVIAIEVVDKRYLTPFRYYVAGPNAGRPESYQFYVPRLGGASLLVGEVHESRLVKFGGAPTEAQEKLRRHGWDMSVLQRVFEALQATGNVWKAIEILTTDANQGIFSVSGLWNMILSDPNASAGDGSTPAQSAVLDRFGLMDLFRSVGRAIVLDKDKEDFRREPTQFSGLPDLSERQWTRVSAASDIPLPLLTGEYPSGLATNGEGPFRTFNALIKAYQEQEYGPPMLDLVKLLLRLPGAPPLTIEQIDALEIEWPPLWEPTAAELADIRLKRAQEGQILIDSQALTPEEVALTAAEESGWEINTELRSASVDAMTETPAETAQAQEQADKEAQLKAMKQGAANGSPGAVPGKPGATPFGKPDGGTQGGKPFPPKRA